MLLCERCGGDLVDMGGSLFGDSYHLVLVCRECDLEHWATFYHADVDCDDFEEEEESNGC